MKSKSGLCPIAKTTKSKSTTYSLSAMGTGRRRPLESGSPNLIRIHSRPVTRFCSSPKTRTGETKYSRLIPSVSASSTSSGMAGISVRVRRYKTVTSLMPERFSERETSIAVFPPPNTAMRVCSPRYRIFSNASSYLGSSSCWERLIVLSTSIPCTTPVSSSPGICRLWLLWAPIARQTA